MRAWLAALLLGRDVVERVVKIHQAVCPHRFIDPVTPAHATAYASGRWAMGRCPDCDKFMPVHKTMGRIILLALLLLLPAPAAALPFDTPPFLTGCGGWQAALGLATYAPPCGDLQLAVYLEQPGWLTVAMFDEVGPFQHDHYWARWAGFERLTFTPEHDGAYLLAIGLEDWLGLYAFDLDLPPHGAPEPATLLLLGASLVAVGWRLRRR